MKMPSMQFYPADWRKDPGVQALDYFERGVWFEMLCLMHESAERGVLLLNGNPMPETALSRVLGLDNQILNQTLTTLLNYGVASVREDGALFCRRMVKDEELCQIRREAGKLGGNPNLVNQNSTKAPTKTQAKNQNRVNQIPTPSSSSSITNNNIKEDEKDFIEQAINQIQNDPLPPKPNTRKDDATRAAFDIARCRFPGTKKGELTEWENFKKKHSNDPNFSSLPDTILKAIEAEESIRNARERAKIWMAPWAHFSTWINQRRWEQEFEAPPKIIPNSQLQYKTAQSQEEVDDFFGGRNLEFKPKTL
jgi:hypothetical protein